MRCPALLLSSALVALLSWGAAAEQAGVAGAVNLDVTGTPPAGSERPVGIGSPIVRDERVMTTRTGLAQILFLDQTTLTVGPNSDIIIDEFVYDPTSAEGHLLMSATVGIFRLIGGGVGTSGGIDVATPFASIGIRGSNVVIEIAGDGSTRVTCNYCEEVVIRSRINPGQEYVISGTDRYRTVLIGPDKISDPFELPLVEVAAIQDALTSRPGQSGGVPVPPTVEQTEMRAPTGGNSDLPASDLTPGAPPPILVAAEEPDWIDSPAADQATTEASQQELRDELVDQFDTGNNGGGNGGNGGDNGGGGDPVQTTLSGFAGGIGGWVLNGDSIDSYGAVGTVTIVTGADDSQASMSVSPTPYWAGFFDELELSYAGPAVTDLEDINLTAQPPSLMDGAPSTSDGGRFYTYQVYVQENSLGVLPDGFTPCTCAFMQWGFWEYQRIEDASGSEPFVRDDALVGTWVAGSTPQFETDLPVNGTAVYTGHALANIWNGEAAYMAAGALTTTVDFTYRTMNGSITDFDGRDYFFATEGPIGTSFSMDGISTDQAVAITLNGAFFTSQTNNVAGIGGNLTLESLEESTYRGAGTFAAECTSGC